MAERRPPETFEDPWSRRSAGADACSSARSARRISAVSSCELNRRRALDYAPAPAPPAVLLRITRRATVTPCPYLRLARATSARRASPSSGRAAPVFGDLPIAKLGGRCGPASSRKVCVGCRCRAFATYATIPPRGDPAAAYQPGAQTAGAVGRATGHAHFRSVVYSQLTWEPAAARAPNAIPSFRARHGVKAVEAYARAAARA